MSEEKNKNSAIVLLPVTIMFFVTSCQSFSTQSTVSSYIVVNRPSGLWFIFRKKTRCSRPANTYL